MMPIIDDDGDFVDVDGVVSAALDRTLEEILTDADNPTPA
jgi:hypothetical protein